MGIDSRCYTEAGLPVPVAPQGGPVLWLKPENVPVVDGGDPVPLWPDASPFKNHFSQNVAVRTPTYQAVGLNGLPSVRFARTPPAVHSLHPNLTRDGNIVPVELGNRHTVYVVGVCSGTLVQRFGVTLPGVTTEDISNFRTTHVRMEASDQFDSALDVYPPQTGLPCLWAWRRWEGTMEQWLNGQMLSSGSWDPAGVALITALLSYGDAPTTQQAAFISEVMVYNWPVDGANHAANMAYLADKYALTIP